MFEESVSLKLVLSVISLLISSAILLLYYSKRISLIHAIVYGFITQVYYIPFVGPTITTFFLVSYVLALDELTFILGRNFKIKKEFLLLFFLPVISIFVAFLYYILSGSPYHYFANSRAGFYLTPAFFYIKSFSPFFLLGSKVYRYFKTHEVETYFKLVKKVVFYSCIVAVCQIFIDHFIGNAELKAALGMKLPYQGNEFSFIRVQAFFAEPKLFAAFIGLALPVFFKDKNYVQASLAIVIGVLTGSHTFLIILLLSFICFIIFKKIRSVRLTIVYSLATILSIFFIISQAVSVVISNASDYQDTFLYNFLVDRAVERYQNNEGDIDPGNDVLGMPLQKDLELPIFKFFSDHPFLVFQGYGPGNSQFIPPKYFEDVNYKYEAQLQGGHANHMNMRWFFYTAEFGLVVFVIYFLLLTRFQFKDPFVGKYYSCVWLIFFFNEVDYFLIIFFLYGYYQTHLYKKKSFYLQPVQLKESNLLNFNM